MSTAVGLRVLTCGSDQEVVLGLPAKTAALEGLGGCAQSADGEVLWGAAGSRTGERLISLNGLSDRRGGARSAIPSCS